MDIKPIFKVLPSTFPSHSNDPDSHGIGNLPCGLQGWLVLSLAVLGSVGAPRALAAEYGVGVGAWGEGC